MPNPRGLQHFKTHWKAVKAFHADLLAIQDVSTLRSRLAETQSALDQTLPDIFDRPADYLLHYDEFRRRFQISKEFQELFARAFVRELGKAQTADEHDRAVLRCFALTEVLGEVIWLLHKGLHQGQRRPVVIGLVPHEAPSEEPRFDTQVSILFSQAIVQKSELQTTPSGILARRKNTKDEFFGWTHEPTLNPDKSEIWQEGNLCNPDYKEAPCRLPSFVFDRTFYEDDRAQIAAAYTRVEKQLVCTSVNGFAFSDSSGCWPSAFYADVEMPQVDANGKDYFEAYVNTAVKPYLTKFKQDYLNRRFGTTDDGLTLTATELQATHQLRSKPVGALAIFFAVPVEPFDSEKHDLGRKQSVDGLFGFITVELVPTGKYPIGTKTLRHITKLLWENVSFFQEPMLRVLATERNTKLKAILNSTEFKSARLGHVSPIVEEANRLVARLQRVAQQINVHIARPVDSLFRFYGNMQTLFADGTEIKLSTLATHAPVNHNCNYEPAVAKAILAQALALARGCSYIADAKTTKEALTISEKETLAISDPDAALRHELSYLGDSKKSKDEYTAAAAVLRLVCAPEFFLFSDQVPDFEDWRAAVIEKLLTDPQEPLYALNRIKRHLYRPFKQAESSEGLPLETIFAVQPNLHFCRSVQNCFDSEPGKFNPRRTIDANAQAWNFNHTGSNEALILFLSRFMLAWEKGYEGVSWIVSKAGRSLHIALRQQFGDGAGLARETAKGLSDLAGRLRRRLAISDSYVVRIPTTSYLEAPGDAETPFLELLAWAPVQVSGNQSLMDLLTESLITIPLCESITLRVSPLRIEVESR